MICIRSLHGPRCAQSLHFKLTDQSAAASTHVVCAIYVNLVVQLGLEAVNRYESNVINTLSDAAKLVHQIGEPNVMVHADLYHMNIEESNMALEVRKCCESGLLQYFHVGASHRGYLGEGSEDLRGALRALAEGRYQGPLVFESFSSAVVDQNLTSALAIWRDLWVDSADLARSARHSIDVEWQAARRAAFGRPL
mmetsp:Transcript_11046/g.29675  ORF Transcript_11046/g.29675 Transcript_11046/m.29675 type:complete len:195 (-) Transcript_11046:195-779(-)